MKTIVCVLFVGLVLSCTSPNNQNKISLQDCLESYAVTPCDCADLFGLTQDEFNCENYRD